jgi:hypothetical protein
VCGCVCGGGVPCVRTFQGLPSVRLWTPTILISRSLDLWAFFSVIILSFFVLTTAYKGALTSVLTVEIFPKAMETVKDLVDNDLYKLEVCNTIPAAGVKE